MPFKKGISGNPSGRTAGTQNEVNKEVKKMIKQFVEQTLSEINLNELTAYERLQIAVKMLPYVATKQEVEEGEIIIKLVDESTSHYDPDY